MKPTRIIHNIIHQYNKDSRKGISRFNYPLIKNSIVDKPLLYADHEYDLIFHTVYTDIRNNYTVTYYMFTYCSLCIKTFAI